MSAIFMDINHGLLVAKLKAYGFSKQVLSFTEDKDFKSAINLAVWKKW